MCEVLFRGKPVKPIDPDTLPEYNKWVKDGWVYGYLIGKNVIVGEIIDFEEDYFNTEFWCGVKPETVGQYTGLNDKNVVEIYTGDICRYFMDNVWKYGVVERLPDGFALRVFRMGERTTNKLFKFQTFIPVPDTGNIMNDQFEVIGNIWDNPELLKA